MRSDPGLVAEYETLKLRLAQEYGDDVTAYTRKSAPSSLGTAECRDLLYARGNWVLAGWSPLRIQSGEPGASVGALEVCVEEGGCLVLVSRHEMAHVRGECAGVNAGADHQAREHMPRVVERDGPEARLPPRLTPPLRDARVVERPSAVAAPDNQLTGR
jgi:hypothetical protein